MPNGIIDPPAIVQETREAVEARRIIQGIQQLEGTLNVNALQEGIELDRLKEIPPETLGYKSYAEVLMAELGLEYRTAHRRIQASQWHTIGGINLSELARISHTRLAYWRVVAEKVGFREVFDALDSGLSDADMKVQFVGEDPPEDPPAAAVIKKRIHCPECSHDFDVEIEA